MRLSLLIAAVTSCGMLTHHEVTKQALYFYNDSSLASILADYPSYLQAGTFFPDWGYACGSESGSEVAHWQPFWKATVEYLSKTYPKPHSNNAKGLIAFLYGVVGHGVSDVLWHSLGINQGFIDAMKRTDFQGKFSDAHSNADFGGDMAISRFTSLKHLEGWSIPFDDLIEIYKILNLTITLTQLKVCTAAAFGLQQLEAGLGKYLFPRFAARSPFLTENLLTYFRGGIHFMATSTSECWKHTSKWIKDGTITSECPQMGKSNYDNNLPPKFTFSNTLCANLQSTLLRTLTNPHKLTITSTTASWFASRLCILTTIPVLPQPRSLIILLTTSFIAFKNHLFSYFIPNTCPPPNPIAILKTKLDYSLLGSTMTKGDFDGDGVEEVVISSEGYSINGYSQTGAVFILNSPVTGYIEDQTNITMVIGNLETGGRFGSGVAVIDWNLDGIDDLAVSAPGLGGTRGLYQDGGVYIYFGSRNGLSTVYDVFVNGSITRAPPFVPFPGEEPIVDNRLHYYGEKLFGVDLDGDGFKDLVVISPHDTPIISGFQRGSLQGFLSTSARSVKVLSYLDADWTLTGSSDYELFGTSITIVNSTMLIGAPGYTLGKFFHLGAVYGYDFSNPRFPQFKFRWIGTENFGSFGSRIDSNPHGDILISSPSAASPQTVPNFMNLPGIIVPGYANGYQGGTVRIRSAVEFNFGSFQSEQVLNGSRSMGHYGSRTAFFNGSWILNEPFVEGERGRVVMYPSPKCWKGASFHDRFGSNLMISGNVLYVQTLTEVFILDLKR